MTYDEALAALYEALPAFHRVGAPALKPGLDNTLILLERLGNPHLAFKSIHIAGTNGKGSSSHMLASIFQEAGYKTGLYTSPHLKDYRERIRVNGAMIPKERVIRFVEEELPRISAGIQPSFFEATVALCFAWFAEKDLDIAVIEVGLGGRLDSTNVITPELSLITNIGLDHVELLGPTLQDIAREKAGIIKASIPVVVSQRQPEVESVFVEQASDLSSPLSFASDRWTVLQWSDHALVQNTDTGKTLSFQPGLPGWYQKHNVCGVLEACRILKWQDWDISDEAIQSGFEQVRHNTGLAGRWQILGTEPLVVADTAHNGDGLRHVFQQAEIAARNGRLTILLGVVGDKDLAQLFPLLPRQARYYFCQPTVFRRLPAEDLAQAVNQNTGLTGSIFPDVNVALSQALSDAMPEDVILITGSTFLVADLDSLKAED